MRRIPTTRLSRYLLQGRIGTSGCLYAKHSSWRNAVSDSPTVLRLNHSSSPYADVNHGEERLPTEPFRKQMKEEAKAKRKLGKKEPNSKRQVAPGWELSVGIEIHAQLNTRSKLFSPARNILGTVPNTTVALFDLAMPGSQPIFQPETLIPAVRAALALNCGIQEVSRWDRKHYFHWDQPAGYQITQYYEPFAKGGHLVLYARDGIATEDGDQVKVRIKQVQMEQDTAKSIAQPGDYQWLDFNRAGVPLIEIITEPDIHHPGTAAAFVKKVQFMLNSIDACVMGMESGGLRADVNVSVRRVMGPLAGQAALGTRTEIKNISSLRAIEDAIIAERDRQIALLEDGGVVEGETRGFSIGSPLTRRLRGKEGEVDYRYMPDPDLGPVVIGKDLVQSLKASMGVPVDEEVELLGKEFGLSHKAAVSLMSMDHGYRVRYLYNVMDTLEGRLASMAAEAEELGKPLDDSTPTVRQLAVTAGNWCINELGKLSAADEDPFDDFDGPDEESKQLKFTPNGYCQIPVDAMADVVFYVQQDRITTKVARDLLWQIFRREICHQGTEYGDVTAAIDGQKLWFEEFTPEEYRKAAEDVLEVETEMLELMRRKPKVPQGKFMFLVGRMLETGKDPSSRNDSRMKPKTAQDVMKAAIDRYLGRLGDSDES